MGQISPESKHRPRTSMLVKKHNFKHQDIRGADTFPQSRMTIAITTAPKPHAVVQNVSHAALPSASVVEEEQHRKPDQKKNDSANAWITGTK